MMTPLGSTDCQTSLVPLTDSLKGTEEKSVIMAIQMNILIIIFVKDYTILYLM